MLDSKKVMKRIKTDGKSRGKSADWSKDSGNIYISISEAERSIDAAASVS